MGWFGAISAMAPGEPCKALRLLAQPRRASLLAALLLAACAPEPRLTYDLSPAAGIAAKGGRGQLAVLMPEAVQPANSDRIVVRTGAQSVAYLTGAQWADNLPSLIQSRLIETFQNAHLLRSVGKPGMLADYSLQTTLRRFELDAAQGEAVVEMTAQLIGPSGRIAAGRLFAAREPVASAAPGAVAAGLDAALRTVMREIVAWAAPKI
ncbi:MAG TPA: ABC-type transport auxiliary lipoprotein family protein [Methylocella sp.]|nr:ABC-type transport auxiliary lipoprotein family protein [Methylocella sp.]